MFGFGRKETLEVQLYGKLPIARDYLRIGCGDGAGYSVRDWMDRGFSGSVEGGEAPRLAWPMRFLIGATPSDVPQGCLWPSADAGGHRPFPFTLFVHRKRKALGGLVEDGLQGIEPVWRDLEAMGGGRVGFGDAEAMFKEWRGRTLAPQESMGPNRIDLGVWSRALWPSEESAAGEEGLRGFLRDLGELKRESRRTPIWLPLVNNLDFGEQVHAWLRALRNLDLFEGSQLPTLFFPQPGACGNQPGWLLVLRELLDPAQVAWLAPLEPDTAPRGPGDFAPRSPALAEGQLAAPGSLPPLADSITPLASSARR